MNKDLFFNTLESIVNSEEQLINITREYSVLGIKLDGVYLKTMDNFGDVNIDSDTYESIVVFMLYKDRSEMIKDEPNIEEILFELKKRFQWIEIYGIEMDKIPIFLKYAIPFYGCIETAYSHDKMINMFQLKFFTH